MKTGILCYPVPGGSGVVATELGKQLADRGHEVHFISYQQPFRLQAYHPRIFYHQVEVPAYPLFKYPPYTFSLVNKIVSVARENRLEILHAHYAIPHSLCALLARDILGDPRLKVITTLHGTDITLVGSDPTFKDTTAYSIQKSDMVTAVSRSLKEETEKMVQGGPGIEVIHNFIDTRVYRPAPGGAEGGAKERVCPGFNGQVPGARGPRPRILLHISNFRPVKRVPDVVRVFARVEKKVPSLLYLVGDGIEHHRVFQEVQGAGLKDKVFFLGNQEDVLPILQEADLLLLPSEKESFGLAALEAMACGLPVIASRVGGIPELVTHGQTGFLYGVGDVEGMARGCLGLLQDPGLYQAFSRRCRQRAINLFDSQIIIPRYEELYLSLRG